MKYPPFIFIMQIIVNGYVWEIKRTRNKDDLRRSDRTITLGVTDVNEFTIYLFDGLHDDLFRKVLIHEICHAFIFSYGFYLTLEEEEFVCSFVDTYAADILSNADWVIKRGLRSVLHL